jgi:hypothetical protein
MPPAQRFLKPPPEMETPMGRLRTLVLQDKANNRHPVLQDVVEMFLDNFTQFIASVLHITYNYQIFLTSCLPPRELSDTVYPWGVKEPFGWMISILEKFFLRESLDKYRGEEKQIESDRTLLRDDLEKMRKLRDDITEASAKRSEIAMSTRWIDMMNKKERIEAMAENIKRLEQEFMAIAQQYDKSATEANKNAALQSVDREAQYRDNLLKQIRDRRGEFEGRLKQR